MKKRISLRAGTAALAGLVKGAGSAWCQSNDFGLGMVTTNGSGAVSWNGAGSLQSFVSLSSGWVDMLEATSPRTVPLTDMRRFFCLISHGGRHSNLLQVKFELCVSNGLI